MVELLVFFQNRTVYEENLVIVSIFIIENFQARLWQKFNTQFIITETVQMLSFMLEF